MMTHTNTPLNRNEEDRDRLIFGEFNPNEYHGGIRYFHGLSLATLQELFDRHFIDPNDRQNDAPTAKQFKAFMERYPAYTAHGYAVMLPRDDYRVTLDGVTKRAPADSMNELKDFATLFKDADTFDASIMGCWFA